jgi:hypothetical protein
MYSEAIDRLNKEIEENMNQEIVRGLIRAVEVLRESSAEREEEIVKAVRRVFSYYVDSVGKSHLYTLTYLRRQKGVSRLRECIRKTKGNLADAEQMMMICVDTIADSKFHMGNNASKRPYNDWEDQLFGSESKMEKWLEEANRG